METSRIVFFIFIVMPTCSETVDSYCMDNESTVCKLVEGESLYIEHFNLEDINETQQNYTWIKTNPKFEYISTDENDNVHYHGGSLFILNVLPENAGLYTGRYIDPSGECEDFHLDVQVFKFRNNPELFYGSVDHAALNKKIECPDPVSYTCEIMEGKITWYKDFNLLQGNHDDSLWIYNTTKKDEGNYTCICTWKHNDKLYNSSGTRRVNVPERVAYRTPVIVSPSKNNKGQFTDEGVGIKLNCSVFCGTPEEKVCHAIWRFPFAQTDGYKQETKYDAKSGLSTAILTIEKVSARDFKAEFNCIGDGYYRVVNETLTLQRRESLVPLLSGGLSVFFLCVLAAGLVKYFAIDLALFFRPYFPQSGHNKDVRVYDAYVVYQTQGLDKAAEDALGQFITKSLPSVLEEKCGYQLFIHGRDDIPGEDLLELVEARMRQSRRLMVILTPSSGSESDITDQGPTCTQNSVIGGFDWQVGLHHALIQREMSVILIQLGDTGPQGYTHLPPGLQHLIRKSAPIKWPEGSRAAATSNSRFWKRVRYLMPAIPVKKYSQSAIV